MLEKWGEFEEIDFQPRYPVTRNPRSLQESPQPQKPSRRKNPNEWNEETVVPTIPLLGGGVPQLPRIPRPDRPHPVHP